MESNDHYELILSQRDKEIERLTDKVECTNNILEIRTAALEADRKQISELKFQRIISTLLHIASTAVLIYCMIK